MSNKREKVELTEIFMAKAGKHGWDRCFHGTIRRGQDAQGNPRVWGKIDVNGTTISARAKDQWELGEKLDEMVIFVLNRITSQSDKHPELDGLSF